MKVLVTGAAGFIGSQLCSALHNQGHDVLGIDALTDYYSPEIKRARFAQLEKMAVQTKVQRVQDLSAADIADMEVIFHLAGQPGVTQSWGEHFQAYVEENISATAGLLELVKQANPKTRVVVASSSSVYGTAETLPTVEGINPQPFSPYGVTKLAAEHLARVYSKNFGIHTVALRYFSVYGPGQRPDMAFSKFFKALQNQTPITIYGDGNQSRDFTYVDDVVAATILAGTAEISPGSVFNISGGSTATVNEVLNIIEMVSSMKFQVEHIADKPGDARHTFGDSSAFRKATGWEPKTKLADGLASQWNATSAVK